MPHPLLLQYGRTASWLAAYSGNIGAFRVLLAAGANPVTPDEVSGRYSKASACHGGNGAA